MSGAGYLTMVHLSLLPLIIFISIPSTVFFAGILVLMVSLGIEPNREPIITPITEVIKVKEPEPVKKGSVKKKSYTTMLRGVDEIREYSLRDKSSSKGEEKGES
jgi:hypothetical protein